MRKSWLELFIAVLVLVVLSVAEPTGGGSPGAKTCAADGDGSCEAEEATKPESSVKIEIKSNDDLYLTQPDPEPFGNKPNEADNKNWTNANWLKSRFHFSFAEWRGGKPQFGVLRVLNDDLIQPLRGFGTHPHRNMEIISYVVEGELLHFDSRQNFETIGRGSVQWMSAGKGVHHSEKNASEDTPCRLIQMWIMPKTSGLDPTYGSVHSTEEERRGKWVHMVGDSKGTAKTSVNQDVNLYVSEIAEQEKLEFPLKENRQAYIIALEGSVEITANGDDEAYILQQHEAAEVVPKPLGPRTAQQLNFKPNGGQTHVLLVEMASA